MNEVVFHITKYYTPVRQFIKDMLAQYHDRQGKIIEQPLMLKDSSQLMQIMFGENSVKISLDHDAVAEAHTWKELRSILKEMIHRLPNRYLRVTPDLYAQLLKRLECTPEELDQQLGAPNIKAIIAKANVSIRMVDFDTVQGIEKYNFQIDMGDLRYLAHELKTNEQLWDSDIPDKLSGTAIQKELDKMLWNDIRTRAGAKAYSGMRLEVDEPDITLDSLKNFRFDVHVELTYEPPTTAVESILQSKLHSYFERILE